jgi:hypothetical protein
MWSSEMTKNKTVPITQVVVDCSSSQERATAEIILKFSGPGYERVAQLVRTNFIEPMLQNIKAGERCLSNMTNRERCVQHSAWYNCEFHKCPWLI